MRSIVLAAVGVAIAGLAACSHAAAPAPAAGSHGTSPASAAFGSHPASAAPGSVPVSCSQRYHAWADGAGKGLLATLDAVSVAATAGNPQALTVALNRAKPAIAQAAVHPVPACADPRGYWSVLLMHVNAAVASKGSASSVQAALKDVPAIHRALIAELKSVSG